MELFASLAIAIFFRCKVTKSAYLHALSLGLIAFVMVFFSQSSETELFGIGIVLCIVSLTILIKGYIIKRFMMAACYYLAANILYLVFLLLLHIFTSKHLDALINPLVTCGINITITLSFLMLKILRDAKKKEGKLLPFYHEMSGVHLFVIFMVMLLCLLLASATTIHTDNVRRDEVTFVSMVILTIIITVGGVLFIYVDIARKKYKEQKRIIAETLELQKKYFQEIYERDVELRKFRHDSNAHMEGIQTLCKAKKYDDLSKYIEKYYDYIKLKIKTNVQTRDPVVDAIVHKYFEYAKASNITVNLQGAFNPDFNVSSFDLCIIFSNALSNALEATMNNCISNKVINIIIRDLEGKQLIQIENTVDYELDTSKFYGTTLKNDKSKHGYGVGNIIDAVCSNNGLFQYINDGPIVKLILLFEIADI